MRSSRSGNIVLSHGVGFLSLTRSTESWGYVAALAVDLEAGGLVVVAGILSHETFSVVFVAGRRRE